MPIMNGIDMCIEIKKDEEISHIPIIVLTANNSVKNRLDSYNLANVDSYLEKPFEMSTLRGVIKVYWPIEPDCRSNTQKCYYIS